MSDPLWGLAAMIRTTLAEQPETVSYVVLDHAQSPSTSEMGWDAQGRRFIVFSPAILDACRHSGSGKPFALTGPQFPWGVPVHRRDRMPPGWPDR